MSQFPDHGINDPDVRSIPDQDMPSTEALLAGTLALMTGHAQGCCDRHRDLMARKIISNLSMLSGHPMASSGFRVTVANLRALWIELRQQRPDPAGPQQAAMQAAAQAAPAGQLRPDPHRALWHTPSETLQ
ncbi:hypothetical protein BH10PSE16_BH10PSE16_07560 [soil metagenome]